MNILSNTELSNISGGAIKWGIAMGIAAALAFIVGIIDGIMNPIRCR